MPKKRPLPATQQDRDFIAGIEAERIKKGLSEQDLAVFLHMSRKTFGIRLQNPETFTLRELRVLKKRLKMEVTV